MERDDNSSILWFLVGALVGLAGAVLLAPESGERARGKLREHAQKGSKYLSESGRDIYEKGRDLYEKGREIAEDAAEMFEKGRSLAEKKIDEAV